MDTDNSLVVTKEKRGEMGRWKREKGVKSMTTEGDLILGGECTMPYTDDVL